MPGPAPKPDARRRNVRIFDMVLPREGHRGRVPKWPLSGRVPAIWAELWKTPQAAAWAKLGYTRVVARYAMLLVEAEKPGAAAALLSEVRQVEDRLGLTPMSMLRLRWVIADDELGAKREEHKAAAPAKGTPVAKRRQALKIVG